MTVPHSPGFERLADAECWRLLGERGVGRIAFHGDAGVQVVPTRYDLHRGTVYLRATTFGQLARGVHGRAAALQVDDVDPAAFTGWSVLVAGGGRRVEDAATVALLWSLGRPRPWSPGPATQWIALVVETIEGQRSS